MIAVLGSGTMGTALATRLRRAGYEVRLGARTGPAYAEVARASEIVFLAVAWPHGIEVARSLGDWGGRILIDVSNPESSDGRSLVLAHSTSGAEEIARTATGARVVKAFNHLYAELLAAPDDRSPHAVPYCGEDVAAKRAVHELIDRCGLDPVDAGPLRVARYLEPLAMLTVELVRSQGWGPTGISWRLVRPASDA